MKTPISASMLYDYVQCPHRVYLDLFGDPKRRDREPSGAASIEWYHHWLESGDAAVRQRILDYNEDDCIAMRV